MTTPAVFRTGDAYQALRVALQSAFGIVVTEEQEHLVSSRLDGLIRDRQFENVKVLAAELAADPSPELCNAVLRALTHSTDRWFDPPELFRLFDEYVLQQILAPERKRSRIWIAGRSQGQLAYSLAMCIADYREQHNLNTRVEITSSDIKNGWIDTARKGIYSRGELSGMPDAWRKQYMLSVGDAMQVNDDIRSMVTFEERNLLEDLNQLGHHDVIICMDVMIYFSVAVRTHILQSFSHLLDPSGILITGPGEAVLPFADTFERVEIDAGVFYRQRA